MVTVFEAKVDADAHLVLRDRMGFQNALRALVNVPVEVTIRRKRQQRSSRQNAFYHAVVVKMVSEFTGYTLAEAHEALKLKFLIVDPDSALPTVRSTTSLTTTEFEDYLERVRQWAASDLGIVIPLPNECEAA